MFSVLHGTNATSGKKSGFEKRTRIHSHCNNYINCRNHHLALLFPPWFWFITFWSLENVSLFTIKMRNIEKNSVNLWQKIIENYKRAVTHWLTHGGASQQILDYLQDLLEATDHVCQDPSEIDVRGYLWKAVSSFTLV